MNIGERQVAALERIASALERCADALNAVEPQYEVKADPPAAESIEFVDTEDGRIPVIRASFS